jgi:hypothetical protein
MVAAGLLVDTLPHHPLMDVALHGVVGEGPVVTTLPIAWCVFLCPNSIMLGECPKELWWDEMKVL